MSARDWMTCPVCGAEGRVVAGGVVSYLGCGRRVGPDDPEYATLPLGREGTEWYGFMVENDRLEWPGECSGYRIWKDTNGTIRTEHLPEIS